MLNLGQGVAWDGYYGRGVRTNHPEDYPEYIRGCDIVSFDIYPVAHSHPQVSGNLWYVAQGVERLVKWAAGAERWSGTASNAPASRARSKATPSQVRSEVWMSLIHGSMGLIYFVHEWEPKFDEAALLHDPEMLTSVTAINRQITELAPVLNSPTVSDAVQVSSSDPQVPVAVDAEAARGGHVSLCGGDAERRHHCHLHAQGSRRRKDGGSAGRRSHLKRAWRSFQRCFQRLGGALLPDQVS